MSTTAYSRNGDRHLLLIQLHLKTKKTCSQVGWCRYPASKLSSQWERAHKITEWLRLEGNWRFSACAQTGPCCPSLCSDGFWMALKMEAQQSVPVLGHPHGKEVFPDVQRVPPVLQFVPIVRCLCTLRNHSWAAASLVKIVLSLSTFHGITGYLRLEKTLKVIKSNY